MKNWFFIWFFCSSLLTLSTFVGYTNACFSKWSLQNSKKQIPVDKTQRLQSFSQPTAPETTPPPTHLNNKNQNQSAAAAATEARAVLTGKCSHLYDVNYCLNGGRCFNFTIQNFTILSCECAEGFMGERCDQKYLSKSYLHLQQHNHHLHIVKKHNDEAAAAVAANIETAKIEDAAKFRDNLKITHLHISRASICYGTGLAFLVSAIFYLIFYFVYQHTHRRSSKLMSGRSSRS